MKHIKCKFQRFIGPFAKNNEGVAAIEYAMIASATGLALAASMPSLQSAIITTYNSIAGFF